MVVTTKMNSASLPPLRPDSEQLVDLHVYQVPEEVWNLKYRSAYNEVINETISIGFVRVWPELSIWNLRTELLNQLGPDCVPGEFVYVRSVGRCLTKVKGRQELELKVKAFLPPRNFAPEIFILEAPQDVPDTALIEASKQETATREDEGASSMEIDGEDDKDEETNVEKVFSSPAPTHPVSDAEPHHSDTTPSDGQDYLPEKGESPRKGGRQETFTKHTNSDSGLGEQTPEEISERIQRENHGPQTTSKDIDSSWQPHYENDGPLPIGRDRIQEHKDPDLRHRSEQQGYFQDSPRGGYHNQKKL
ncbi:putative trichohyalin-like [Apostichopus japonicus]|uniref:Putative trichohyalin-like n=1 Tax=Stichopus japonicus TaxID=307972 RepID=A0A2G8K774_STIJA|nr:putative trichohyalin-like [Apostichopus japonicus]